MEKDYYEHRIYESVDDGAHLGLHLKNLRKANSGSRGLNQKHQK